MAQQSKREEREKNECKRQRDQEDKNERLAIKGTGKKQTSGGHKKEKCIPI